MVVEFAIGDLPQGDSNLLNRDFSTSCLKNGESGS